MWGQQGGYDQSYGDQGGGFFNSDAPQFGSQGQSEKKTPRSRAQSSLSCTVAQIQNSKQEDERFMLDNIELHQVTLIGLIRSVRDSATKIDYEFDDMTGPPLDVKQFVDNDENTPDEERIVPARENTYVRIHGHVRPYQSKKLVAAFRVIPINNANEITTHMLECIQNHLYLTKASNKTEQPPSHGTGFVPRQNNSNNSTAQIQQVPDQGLSAVQNQVFNIIRGCSDEQGVNVGLVCDSLRGVPQKAIREAIEFLSSEGHIYSTIDDDHFKSTDS